MTSPRPGSRDQVNVRLTPVVRDRLERLARDHKTTVSGAMRIAVMQATKHPGGVPSEREVLELLGEQARCGTVSALRELRSYHRERASAEDDRLVRFDRTG
jgi:hypothetical protein